MNLGVNLDELLNEFTGSELGSTLENFTYIFRTRMDSVVFYFLHIFAFQLMNSGVNLYEFE